MILLADDECPDQTARMPASLHVPKTSFRMARPVWRVVAVFQRAVENIGAMKQTNKQSFSLLVFQNYNYKGHPWT